MAVYNHEDYLKYGQRANNLNSLGLRRGSGAEQQLSSAQIKKLLSKRFGKEKAKPFTSAELKTIRDTIASRGLQMKYVAKQVGMTPHAFCMMLSGERKYLKKKEIICKYLGLNLTNNMEAAKFILRKLFKTMKNRRELNDDTTVTLEITSKQALPNEFYDELTVLLSKYC